MKNIERARELLSKTGFWQQSYNGKDGCACGCRGNYNEKPGVVERQRKKMLNMLELDEVIKNPNCIMIQETTNSRLIISIRWIGYVPESLNYDPEKHARVSTIYSFVD